MADITLSHLVNMTDEYGQGWALPHARRLICLIKRIRGDLTYDQQALMIAVYLHDWGAFPRYRQDGVDHALRSRQVAETEILPRMALPSQKIALILEAIEYHDYRDLRPAPSIEALLLREADCLDFLGVIGLARGFAEGPNNLVAGYRRILARREAIRERFTLPEARAMAEARLGRLAQSLAWLEEESFGHL